MVFAISGEAVWPDTNPGRNRRDQALTAITRFLTKRADGTTDRPRFIQPGDGTPVAYALDIDTGAPAVRMEARFEATADQADAWTNVLANLAAATATSYLMQRHFCMHDEATEAPCVVDLTVSGP